MDGLITHPSEAKFTTDTMTIIVVLKSRYFSADIQKQALNHLCSAYRVAPRPMEWFRKGC